MSVCGMSPINPATGLKPTDAEVLNALVNPAQADSVLDTWRACSFGSNVTLDPSNITIISDITICLPLAGSLNTT